ncbi:MULTISPECIES: hypothetical protein [unclassified Flavobacterium]|uniref:hypothetical protein n=1 Tax=unclassified Flavobacterium TaxID=196869 RepID=UPI0012A9F0A7|nr:MULTISPECIES: hypothetical protein [unclassified Flavobacterium]MBF4485847.1 hypothetical protein [Flavobacterium sp. CSZ]QGK75244.1 hypothetical protein GIY83_14515 [Flavobacterium sp. SLB02]
MAKKKINIILIIVVLGLWGTVGFKTINGYFGQNTVIANTEIQTKNLSLKRIDKDTFALEKINRDPFLNKQFQQQAARVKLVSYHNPVKKVPAIVPKKPITNLNWPTLKYFGYLKSKDQELVLLKIDSKLHKLKLNDPVDGLVVRRKFKDSIEVSFNSQNRIIHLR